MEMPSVDGTTNSDVSISTQRMPDFAASAQYNWNSNSHIKLGAIVRSMTYSSNVHDKAFSTTGFGLQASTTFNVTKKWQVFGQLNYGKAYSIIFARMSLYPEHIACPDFTLKTTIRVLTRKLIGKVSTLLQMPFGM